MSDLKNDLLKLKNKLENIDSSIDLSKMNDEEQKEKLNKRIDDKLNTLYERGNKSIKLNVGGKCFDIAKFTITNSRFETILNKHINRNSNEAIFVDINPAYFLSILNIVREKCKGSDPSKKIVLNLQDCVDELVFRESLVRFFNGNPDILKEIEFKTETVYSNNQQTTTNQTIPLPIVNNNYNITNAICKRF